MPQQRRAQVTRRAIVIAAAEEFDRAGFEATPLSAILRRGGVTKGAFYFHFPSKDSVAAVLVRFQAQAWEKVWRRWTDRGLDPLTTAVGIVDEAARVLERDVVIRAGTQLAYRAENPVPDWEQRLGELFRRSAQLGLLRSGADPAAATRVLHAALIGVRVLVGRRHAGMAQQSGEVWRIVLGGIASAEWLRENPSALAPPPVR